MWIGKFVGGCLKGGLFSIASTFRWRIVEIQKPASAEIEQKIFHSALATVTAKPNSLKPLRRSAKPSVLSQKLNLKVEAIYGT